MQGSSTRGTHMCLTTSYYNDPNNSNSLYKITATTTTIPTYIHYGDFVTIENLALQSGPTYVVLYYSLESKW